MSIKKQGQMSDELCPDCLSKLKIRMEGYYKGASPYEALYQESRKSYGRIKRMWLDERKEAKRLEVENKTLHEVIKNIKATASS